MTLYNNTFGIDTESGANKTLNIGWCEAGSNDEASM